MNPTTVDVVLVVFIATLVRSALGFGEALLGTVPAILAGRTVNHRLPEETYLKYVYSGLAAIAALLLIQAITK